MDTTAEKPLAETVWLFNQSQLYEAVRLYLDRRFDSSVVPGGKSALRIALDTERDVILEFMVSPQARHLTCGTTASETGSATLIL